MKEFDKVNDYTIYIVAGIATSPNFFANLVTEIRDYYHSRSIRVVVHIVYPYGNWSTKLAVQVKNILWDLKYSYKNANRSYGSQQTRKYILQNYEHGKIIIIGHSGGSIAGYHASHLLSELDGIDVERIVQIGSPKVRISSEYQDKTMYIKATAGADVITRLGSWGGVSKSPYQLPSWNRYKYAPNHRFDLNIIGGHPDYFRNHEPFTDEFGVSNLSKTMNIIYN